MAIRVPRVGSCCCCISLRTGATIWGILSLVAFSYFFVGRIDWIIKFSKRHMVDVIRYIELSGQLFQVVASVLLLLAIYKSKAKLMPWWLVSTVLIALLEINGLYDFTNYLILRKENDFEIETSDYLMICRYIFTLTVEIFGWLVVYSYYRTLSDQGEDCKSKSQQGAKA